MTPLRVLSLFAGIGGIDLGLERAGMRVVAHSEIEPHACRVLDKHWPSVPNLGDVSAIDWTEAATCDELGTIDVIAAGFPCQDISNAGKQAGVKEGTRSGLFFEIVRAIRELRPRYVILENVAALLGSNGELTWEPCSGNWPRAGLMRNGTVYPLPPLARLTDVTASSSWPTPVTTDARGARNLTSGRQAGSKHHSGTTLTDAAWIESKLWPTPDAGAFNLEESVESFDARRAAVKAKGINGNGMGEPLAVAARREARLWPTPTTRERKDTGDCSNVPENSLLGRTAKPSKAEGSLHPDFSCWLMGFPIGWASFEPTATP